MPSITRDHIRMTARVVSTKGVYLLRKKIILTKDHGNGHIKETYEMLWIIVYSAAQGIFTSSSKVQIQS